MGRRSFGSARELPSGRWQVRYRGADGLTYRAPQTYARRGDAERFLATVESDIVRGSWRAPARTTTTVADYIEHSYIDARTRIVGKGGLKRTTAANYKDLLRLHIAPTVGRKRLGDLTPAMVRDWHSTLVQTLEATLAARQAAMIAQGRTPSVATVRDGRTTAAHAYRLLSQAMNQAVDDELIPRNPCRVKGARNVRSSARPTASVQEVMALADAVPPRYRLMVLLGAYMSPRKGELLALQRRDLAGDRIKIRERLYSLAGEHDWDAPKSAAGVRELQLLAPLALEVEQHLTRWVAADPDALVFTTANGHPVTGWQGIWNRARVKAGRPDLRFHDLRHTGATLAVLAGAMEAELMRRLGHSTTAAARLYQHSSSEHADAVTARLAQIIAAEQAGGADVVDIRTVARRRRA